MVNSSSETAVCPRCLYGFRSNSTTGNSICPRRSAGIWLSIAETSRLSQGVLRGLTILLGTSSASRDWIQPVDSADKYGFRIAR